MRGRISRSFGKSPNASHGIFKGDRGFATVPLKNPVGPSSLTPPSDVNFPAHLRG